MTAYQGRKAGDPTEDYEELAKWLIFSATAAMMIHKQSEQKLNPKTKQLRRRRGELKRDQAATHLEKVASSKACRAAMKGSLREHRKSKLLSTAAQRERLK
ncbi:hypothetical protein ANCDUO_12010 [Ancylostoma duodenale]|uniref:Uncharacterized protein n=1 Tax=Ancylostoma duodenale TaxID=51022 RepID=A0A0C2GA01_9BILA|nr:hypothetical protein ANCDUO_12010 [Ancylostoma duodenale]